LDLVIEQPDPRNTPDAEKSAPFGALSLRIKPSRLSRSIL
jgi:hypothetical protein